MHKQLVIKDDKFVTEHVPVNTKVKMPSNQKSKFKNKTEIKFKRNVNSKNIDKSENNKDEMEICSYVEKTAKTIKDSTIKDVTGKDNFKLEEDEELKLKRTLFVGNLPLNITKKDLMKMFKKFGSLTSVRLRGSVPDKVTIPKRIAEITRKFHKSQQSRIGYVVFESINSAISALALNGTKLENHHIVVDRASNPSKRKLYDHTKSIFIGNLPFDVDDESIWTEFAQFGEIEAVRVVRDKESGVGKGFGYVSFKEKDSKIKALASETLELNDRKIRIKGIDKTRKSDKISRVGKPKTSLPMKKDGPQKGQKSLKKRIKQQKRIRNKKRIADKLKPLLKS